MYHVLEHLHDPRRALCEARRLLAPRGKLIVQVPNLGCWQYRVFGSRWNGLDVPRHLYNFRFEDLKRLLESCGFGVNRVKHFSWRDNRRGWPRPSLPRSTRRRAVSAEGIGVRQRSS